jgi:hypothetical protein
MLVLWTMVGTPLLVDNVCWMKVDKEEKGVCCWVDPILAHLQSKKDKDWARETLEEVEGKFEHCTIIIVRLTMFSTWKIIYLI